MKILVELRPAFDGHAGIPQETRLLFRGLRQLPGQEVDGLIQSSQHLLAPGLPADERAAKGWPLDKRFNRQSRVVVSAAPGRSVRKLELLKVAVRHLATLVGRGQSLGRFEGHYFSDFVWRALFAQTLPLSDFDNITSAGYRVLRLPYSAMHQFSLALRYLFLRPIYPKLDTAGYRVFVAETPFPGRVTAGTTLIVRYHDAIPILMPHSIKNREHHQALHMQALRRNVKDGAWFACVSDATRNDLLKIFPEVAARAVTIPNMVSHHYFREESTAARVPDILVMRCNRKVSQRQASLSDGDAANVPPYLLMVSTVEPRKNHLGLLSAWEQLRNHGYPDLKLVFVGSLGWGQKSIVAKCLPWIQQGKLVMLEDVPADELRLLYRHAAVTVCPSFGEGFDFPGVEAMRCGGVVAASDIQVHRDVYSDADGAAADFFNPYAPGEIAAVLATLLDPANEAHREAQRRHGARVSGQYLPEKLLPQWQSFLGIAAGA